MSAEWIEQWFERLGPLASSDAEIAAISPDNEFTFLIVCGTAQGLFAFRGGHLTRLAPIDISQSWDFDLIGSEQTWSRFLSEIPPRYYNDIFAMNARVDDFRIGGSRLVLMQNIRVVLRLMELGRRALHPTTEPNVPTIQHERDATPRYDAITGRYVTLVFRDVAYRVYFEEAGQGQPLILLHTAGSDSRQYMHMLNDATYTRSHRLIAFDMPGHGRSLPPDGWWQTEYLLTTDFYAEFVMAFIRAIGVSRPIVMGCSMGGEIVLELAYRFAGELKAVIGCESSDKVEARSVRWAHHPRVNETEAVPSWVWGLCSPTSPERHRREIWWEYSQQGPGVFTGDIHFYTKDWDARSRVARIDTRRCPVYLLTGEYDFSCRTEASAETASKISGATFTKMEGLGHFPMAEDPERFKPYMVAALAAIEASQGGATP